MKSFHSNLRTKVCVMYQTSKLIKILITAICFFAFFLFGFTDNLKGPTLPAILAELNLSYGAGGNIFFGEYLGFLIATLIAGLIADKFGLKSVLILAGICLALGVSGYSSFENTILLGVCLFIIGLGFGAFELGPNAIIVEVYKENKGLFLNLMAVMHGLGSALAPYFASRLFELNISWRVIYRWDLALILIFLVCAAFLRFPQTTEKTQINFRQIPQIAFKKSLPLFYIAIASYVAAEIGIASWLVTYLQKIDSASSASSNQALTLFFAALMIGRLIGGFIVQRLGYIRSILFSAMGSLFCLGIGIFTTQTIFLPLTGLFFSIIFPTITAAVSDDFHENINTILGTLFTFAGVGSLIGPWLIGWVSTAFGLEIGFGLNILFTAILALSTFLLLQRHKTKNLT
ncbi:MAG: MFS transporter [Anaerolineales bacterium]|nr:MFS transporter [Anaerolineales bacterium]